MNLFASEGLYDNRVPSESNAYHNARDPGELTYTLNPDLWCAELLPQLTCCSIHKDECQDGGAAGTRWHHRYGRIAITKRHLLSCFHAHSAASGTWNGVVNTQAPNRIRFIGNDGLTVDRIQIHQSSNLGYDLNVAVLDEDLPESVYIPKVAPSNRQWEMGGYEWMSLSQEFTPEAGPDARNWNRYALYFKRAESSIYTTRGIYYWAREPGTDGAGIAISHVISGTGSSISIAVIDKSITITHGSEATINQVIAAVTANPSASALVSAELYNIQNTGGDFPVAPASSGVTGGLAVPHSDYNILNRAMFHCGGVDGLQYAVWAGDSGTPYMSLVNGEIIVTGIISGSMSHGFPVNGKTWPQVLNDLIASADANAISLGRMSEPTGYTVTPYTGTIL